MSKQETEVEAEFNALLATIKRQRDAAQLGEARAEGRAAVAEHRREALSVALTEAQLRIAELEAELATRPITVEIGKGGMGGPSTTFLPVTRLIDGEAA